MSQQQPLPAFSSLNEGEREALNPLTPAQLEAFMYLLEDIDTDDIVETLQSLFRGWIASDEVPHDPAQRGDLFFQYERILKCFQTPS